MVRDGVALKGEAGFATDGDAMLGIYDGEAQAEEDVEEEDEIVSQSPSRPPLRADRRAIRRDEGDAPAQRRTEGASKHAETLSRLHRSAARFVHEHLPKLARAVGASPGRPCEDVTGGAR